MRAWNGVKALQRTMVSGKPATPRSLSKQEQIVKELDSKCQLASMSADCDELSPGEKRSISADLVSLAGKVTLPPDVLSRYLTTMQCLGCGREGVTEQRAVILRSLKADAQPADRSATGKMRAVHNLMDIIPKHLHATGFVEHEKEIPGLMFKMILSAVSKASVDMPFSLVSSNRQYFREERILLNFEKLLKIVQEPRRSQEKRNVQALHSEENAAMAKAMLQSTLRQINGETDEKHRLREWEDGVLETVLARLNLVGMAGVRAMDVANLQPLLSEILLQSVLSSSVTKGMPRNRRFRGEKIKSFPGAHLSRCMGLVSSIPGVTWDNSVDVITEQEVFRGLQNLASRMTSMTCSKVLLYLGILGYNNKSAEARRHQYDAELGAAAAAMEIKGSEDAAKAKAAGISLPLGDAWTKNPSIMRSLLQRVVAQARNRHDEHPMNIAEAIIGMSRCQVSVPLEQWQSLTDVYFGKVKERLSVTPSFRQIHLSLLHHLGTLRTISMNNHMMRTLSNTAAHDDGSTYDNSAWDLTDSQADDIVDVLFNEMSFQKKLKVSSREKALTSIIYLTGELGIPLDHHKLGGLLLSEFEAMLGGMMGRTLANCVHGLSTHGGMQHDCMPSSLRKRLFVEFSSSMQTFDFRDANGALLGLARMNFGTHNMTLDERAVVDDLQHHCEEEANKWNLHVPVDDPSWKPAKVPFPIA